MTPRTNHQELRQARPRGRCGWWLRGFSASCLAGALVWAAAMALSTIPMAWAGQADLASVASHASSPAPEGRRLALLVGVGAFADRSFNSLTYAHNDVDAMRKWLLASDGGGFRASDVTVLLDEKATRAEILRQAKRLAEETRPEDLVLLYFSSHGFFTTDKVVGVVCYDTRATGHTDASGAPIVFRDQSLTREDLYQFLGSLPAERRAVIVDVCHGGQLAGEQPPAASQDSAISPDSAAKAGNDAERTTLVLASCLGSERSWESQELESSIFTHYIIKGLKQKGGDLVAAFNLAREETERQSQCEKGICQTPYLIQQPPDRGLSLAPPKRKS